MVVSTQGMRITKSPAKQAASEKSRFLARANDGNAIVVNVDFDRMTPPGTCDLQGPIVSVQSINH